MIDARDRARMGSRQPRRSRRPSSTTRSNALARPDRERAARTCVALGKRAFYAQDQLPEDAAYDIAARSWSTTRRPTTRTKACARSSRSGRRSGGTASRRRRSAPLRRARAAPSPRVRAALDRRVRLEHRHVDGDARARHLRAEAHRSGRVDGHDRGGRVRADRVLRADRRRARRPLPAQAAPHDHDASCRPGWPRCSRCCSRIGHPSPLVAHGDRRSATASAPGSASPRSRRSSPTSFRSRISPARSRCRRRSTTSAASSGPRSPAS